MSSRPPLIAVCGTSQASPAEAEAARRVGRLVAERGGVVVCGGLGGVMAAAAQGARDGGGISVGFLPGDDPGAAADDLTLAFPTGLGELRNGLIARSSAAMIAIGGGYGTLSEIGFMLRLGRPVTGLGTWPIIQPGQTAPDPALHLTTGPDDAVAWAFAQIEGRGGA